ncbi:hypothetical protein AB0I53_45510 [Saccharopolyspora sp. NPDC050389]|uniref:hypothetical protein n=1 Tax=Saccharopolyspora sp. NPDC050389 TaxID=3155516 RepID=UPI0033D4745C
MDYDVDEFGILDPPPPAAPEPTIPPASGSEETPAILPTTSIIGNGNETVSGDYYKQHIEVQSATFVLTKDNSEVTYAEARVQKRFGRGLQDREALQQLADSYVPPPGLLGEDPKAAFQVLHERQILMLTAVTHEAGQFSAGLRLGYELQKRYAGLVVREELIEQDSVLHAETLLVEHEPAAVLVDLRWAGEEDFQNIRRGLVEFTDELEQYRSYLILIIPHEQERKFEDSFPGRVHRLAKPSSTEVFASYSTVSNPHELIDSSDSAEALEQLWPPQIKEIANAVSDRSDRGEPPEQALQDVLRERLESRTPQLRETISKYQALKDTEWIALLLAAGILEGSSARHIVAASDQLLKHSGAKREEVIPLLRPSPFTRLSRITDHHFDLHMCAFQPRGSGVQVLRHAWREHADLRPTLLTWLGELPRQIRDLEREELERIADRGAELATEGGYNVAVTLAGAWAKTEAGEKPDAYRRSIAVRLLTTAATDPSLGKSVRQKLWEWSRESNADRQLLTAEVCAGIGQAFPRIALTRLKHLANSENDLVRTAVRTAVEQIGAELGGSTFLRYLTDWFDEASPARLQVLAEGVATVLTDQTLDVDPDAASSFWQRALNAMPPGSLRPIVGSWLRTAALATPEQRDVLVEPLVQAAKQDSRRIAQLQHASRFDRTYLDLSSFDEDLSDVVEQLWTRLDEVDPIWR